MKNLVLSLGSMCSSRCIFCKDGRIKHAKAGPLPLAGAEAELREHFSSGCRHAVFLGGEPMLYPQLPAAVRLARAIGYEAVEISTNGLHCQDRRLVLELLSSGVTQFTVSVHSHLPKVEERLTRIPGALRRKVAGLKFLLECRSRGLLPGGLQLNPVLSSVNYKGLSPFIGYFHGLGIEKIHFNFIGGCTFMWPLGPALRRSRLMPTYAQVMPYLLDAIRRWGAEPGLGLRFGDIPICALPWGGTFDRFLRSAADRHLGDQESQSLVSFGGWRADWDEFLQRELKFKTTSCRRCVYGDRCRGILKVYRDVHGPGRITPVLSPARDMRR